MLAVIKACVHGNHRAVLLSAGQRPRVKYSLLLPDEMNPFDWEDCNTQFKTHCENNSASIYAWICQVRNIPCGAQIQFKVDSDDAANIPPRVSEWFRPVDSWSRKFACWLVIHCSVKDFEFIFKASDQRPPTVLFDYFQDFEPTFVHVAQQSAIDAQWVHTALVDTSKLNQSVNGRPSISFDNGRTFLDVSSVHSSIPVDSNDTFTPQHLAERCAPRVIPTACFVPNSACLWKISWVLTVAVVTSSESNTVPSSPQLVFAPLWNWRVGLCHQLLDALPLRTIHESDPKEREYSWFQALKGGDHQCDFRRKAQHCEGLVSGLISSEWYSCHAFSVALSIWGSLSQPCRLHQRSWLSSSNDWSVTSTRRYDAPCYSGQGRARS